jgi:short-subunit dehydrogenase
MNAIITGASKGIGYHTAVQLAENGCHLLLLSRDETSLKELSTHCRRISPASVNYKKVDLMQLGDHLSDLTNFIENHFDASIDILINNAGSLQNKKFDAYTEKDVLDTMRVNFMAPAQLIATFIPYLLQTDNAHVVNISSMGGFQGSVKFSGLSYYSASKGALNVLTESLAEEYKNSGIVFNALALGAVQTNMFNQAFPEMEAPVSARSMGKYVADFAMNGYRYFNGKVLPVSYATP